MNIAKTIAKPISIVSAFLILTFTGDRIAGIALEQFTSNSQYRFSRLYAGNEDATLVVVGNSRAARDFSPTKLREIAGGNVNNIGFPGMSMSIAGAMLLDYLDLNQHPKLVLIEITNIGDPGTHELLNNLGPFAGQSERLQSLMERYIPDKAIFFIVSHLYRYNGDMLPRILFSFKTPDLDMPSAGRITPRMREVLATRIVEPLDIAKENVQALLEMIRACQENDIRVALVVAPYLPIHFDRIGNYLEWRNDIQRIVGNDVPLLDYSVAINSDQYFRDGVHLNNDGVDAFLTIANRDLRSFF